MARDPLGVLLTVRQRAVDQSRQALATCLAAETAAMAAIRSIDGAIEREREAADRRPDDHRGTEMLSAWLGRMRDQRRGAVAALAAAEGQTAAARAVLSAARASAQAVQRTIAERAALAHAEAAKREQHTLDDISRAQYVARRGGEAAGGDT